MVKDPNKLMYLTGDRGVLEAIQKRKLAMPPRFVSFILQKSV